MTQFVEKWCLDKRKLQIQSSNYGIKISLIAGSSLTTFVLDPDEVGAFAAALWECSPAGVRNMEALHAQVDPQSNTASSSQAKEATKAAEWPIVEEAPQEGRGPDEKADAAAQG